MVLYVRSTETVFATRCKTTLDQFCNLTTSIGEEFMIFLGEHVPPRHPGLHIEKVNVMSRHGASINLQICRTARRKLHSELFVLPMLLLPAMCIDVLWCLEVVGQILSNSSRRQMLWPYMQIMACFGDQLNFNSGSNNIHNWCQESICKSCDPTHLFCPSSD